MRQFLISRKPNKRFFIQIISFLLVHAFVFQQAAFAASETSFLSPKRDGSVVEHFHPAFSATRMSDNEPLKLLGAKKEEKAGFITIVMLKAAIVSEIRRLKKLRKTDHPSPDLEPQIALFNQLNGALTPYLWRIISIPRFTKQKFVNLVQKLLKDKAKNAAKIQVVMDFVTNHLNGMILLHNPSPSSNAARMAERGPQKIGFDQWRTHWGIYAMAYAEQLLSNPGFYGIGVQDTLAPLSFKEPFKQFSKPFLEQIEEMKVQERHEEAALLQKQIQEMEAQAVFVLERAFDDPTLIRLKRASIGILGGTENDWASFEKRGQELRFQPLKINSPGMLKEIRHLILLPGAVLSTKEIKILSNNRQFKGLIDLGGDVDKAALRKLLFFPAWHFWHWFEPEEKDWRGLWRRRHGARFWENERSIFYFSDSNPGAPLNEARNVFFTPNILDLLRDGSAARLAGESSEFEAPLLNRDEFERLLNTQLVLGQTPVSSLADFLGTSSLRTVGLSHPWKDDASLVDPEEFSIILTYSGDSPAIGQQMIFTRRLEAFATLFLDAFSNYELNQAVEYKESGKDPDSATWKITFELKHPRIEDLIGVADVIHRFNPHLEVRFAHRNHLRRPHITAHGEHGKQIWIINFGSASSPEKVGRLLELIIQDGDIPNEIRQPFLEFAETQWPIAALKEKPANVFNLWRIVVEKTAQLKKGVRRLDRVAKEDLTKEIQDLRGQIASFENLTEILNGLLVESFWRSMFGMPLINREMMEKIRARLQEIKTPLETKSLLQFVDNYLSSAARLTAPSASHEITGKDILAADSIDVTKLPIERVKTVAGIKNAAEKRQAMIDANPVVLLVRSATVVDDGLVAALPRLRYIIRLGHGIDNITASKALLSKRGIKVVATKGSAKSITAWTLRAMGRALQNAYVSDLPESPNLLASGFLTPQTFVDAAKKRLEAAKISEEEKADYLQMARSLFPNLRDETIAQLKGKTVGIIGVGNIGSEIALATKVLEMKVLVNSRTAESNPSRRAELQQMGYEVASEEEIYSSSHFVVLITGENDTTKGKINDAAVDLMIKNSNLIALINPDRPGVVHQPSVERLLEIGKVKYIVDDFPLLPFLRKNFLFTPHIGGSTKEAEDSVLRNTGEILSELTNLSAWSNISVWGLRRKITKERRALDARSLYEKNDYRKRELHSQFKAFYEFEYVMWGLWFKHLFLRISGKKVMPYEVMDRIQELERTKQHDIKYLSKFVGDFLYPRTGAPEIPAVRKVPFEAARLSHNSSVVQNAAAHEIKFNIPGQGSITISRKGASIMELSLNGFNFPLVRRPEPANESEPQKKSIIGNFPMMPWSGRLPREFKIKINGEEKIIDLGKLPGAVLWMPDGYEGEKPYVLHGLLRNIEWQWEESDYENDGSIVFSSRYRDIRVSYEGIPEIRSLADIFGDLEHRVAYKFVDGKFRTERSVTNLGNTTAHTEIGDHLTLNLGSKQKRLEGWRVRIPADKQRLMNDHKMPVLAQLTDVGSQSDFRSFRPLDKSFELGLAGLKSSNGVVSTWFVNDQDKRVVILDWSEVLGQTVFWSPADIPGLEGLVSVQPKSSSAGAHALHQAGVPDSGLISILPGKTVNAWWEIRKGTVLPVASEEKPNAARLAENGRVTEAIRDIQNWKNANPKRFHEPNTDPFITKLQERARQIYQDKMIYALPLEMRHAFVMSVFDADKFSLVNTTLQSLYKKFAPDVDPLSKTLSPVQYRELAPQLSIYEQKYSINDYGDVRFGLGLLFDFFEDETSFLEQRYVIDQINKELNEPGSGDLQEIVAIQDIHNGARRFQALVGYALGLPKDSYKDIHSLEGLKQLLVAHNIDIQKLNLRFVGMADQYDRGPHPIEVADTVRWIAGEGKAKFFIGNHDFWRQIAVLQVHGLFDRINPDSEENKGHHIAHWSNESFRHAGWGDIELDQINQARFNRAIVSLNHRVRVFNDKWMGKEEFNPISEFRPLALDKKREGFNTDLRKARKYNEELQARKRSNHQDLETQALPLAPLPNIFKETLQYTKDSIEAYNTQIEWLNQTYGRLGLGLPEIAFDVVDLTNFHRDPEIIERTLWELKNFRLFYVDVYGNLHMHNILPIKTNSGFDVSYKGQEGLRALELMSLKVREFFQDLNTIPDDPDFRQKMWDELGEIFQIINSWYSDKMGYVVAKENNVKAFVDNGGLEEQGVGILGHSTQIFAQRSVTGDVILGHNTKKQFNSIGLPSIYPYPSIWSQSSIVNIDYELSPGYSDRGAILTYFKRDEKGKITGFRLWGYPEGSAQIEDLTLQGLGGLDEEQRKMVKRHSDGVQFMKYYRAKALDDMITQLNLLIGHANSTDRPHKVRLYQKWFAEAIQERKNIAAGARLVQANTDPQVTEFLSEVKEATGKDEGTLYVGDTLFEIPAIHFKGPNVITPSLKGFFQAARDKHTRRNFFV